MKDLATRVLNGSRKKLFRKRPIFENRTVISERDLGGLEASLGCTFPAELRTWLLEVGFGQFDQTLSLERGWLKLLEEGPLAGTVVFAQDEVGNFYSFHPTSGEIFFLSRSDPGFARVAPTFEAFLRELIRRDYQLIEWVDSLRLEAT